MAGAAEGPETPPALGPLGSAGLVPVLAPVTCGHPAYRGSSASRLLSCLCRAQSSQEETDDGKTTCLARAAVSPTPEPRWPRGAAAAGRAPEGPLGSAAALEKRLALGLRRGGWRQCGSVPRQGQRVCSSPRVPGRRRLQTPLRWRGGRQPGVPGPQPAPPCSQSAAQCLSDAGTSAPFLRPTQPLPGLRGAARGTSRLVLCLLGSPRSIALPWATSAPPWVLPTA